MFGFLSRPKKVTRVAAPPGAVQRSTATLMQQRGWTKTSTGWAGPFATKYGTWPGSFEIAGDTIRMYIRNPPNALRKHPRWVCFHDHGKNWWRMHLAVNPVNRDPNAVIRYVEQIITQSHKL